MVNQLFQVTRTKQTLTRDEAIARVLPFVAAATNPTQEKLISNLFTDVSIDGTMIERVWNALSDKDREYFTQLAKEMSGLVFALQEGITE